MQKERNKLVVYRASAGSGKTHQLTGEYLALLFSDPFAYRHILAVTFTNKATDEMKTRIIEELANLATTEKSDYVKALTAKFDISEDKLRIKARQVLVRILHDYSAFSVSTIDRFFQQAMRAFARELGLGGGYNIELDQQKVLGEAIDSMLYDLERSENKQLLNWLIRFSEEKIENGETWNIRNDIKELSKEIFKEDYRLFSDRVQEDIADKELVADYKKELGTTIALFEKQVVAIAKKAANIIGDLGLSPQHFKGGKNSPFKNFYRWAQGEMKVPSPSFCDLANNLAAWYSPKVNNDIRKQIKIAYSNGLNDCVCEMLQHFGNSLAYNTAYEINRYYFTLGILSDVDKKIREYATEKNVMLISDTTELLNRIIQGDDTPFVYEKIGTRIDHYMIDEFQDTSGMQWANFMPLLKDSLAGGKRNLIVGDVKQSIYRWRNSDWNLLDEQLDIDFRMEGIDHQTLDTNWRSSRNVIDFNNTIFAMGAKVLQRVYNDQFPDKVRDKRILPLSSKILRAYTDSFQLIPSIHAEDLGRVQLNFIDTQEYLDWSAHVLEKLPSTLEDLQQRGYALKDIAILVRTKKEGAEVADCLLQYKGKHPESKYRYDIISDEALFLANARSIKLIISLMNYLRTPANPSLRTLAIYEYYKFKNQLSAEEALLKHFSIDQDFSEDVALELRRIRELPLYEMTEELFNLFRKAMAENENIYIQSFLDCVLDFSVRSSSDLDSFLMWWKESGIKKTIFTPDGQDAIRIMTIHKSKGLGFDVVLLPFCNWELDHKMSTILWCQPKVEPFDRLQLVPVKYSQRLSDTIFEYEYYREKMLTFIDNLNIMYVAFTRAKHELITFSPKPKREGEISNIASLLWFSVNNSVQTYVKEDFEKYIDLPSHVDTVDDSEGAVMELGKGYRPNGAKSIRHGHDIQMGSSSSISFEDRLKLRLNNKYYFTESGMRQYGTMMHEIISKVGQVSDLENVVDAYCQTGDITTDEKVKIFALLQTYLEDEEVKSWYSGGYKILNEVQILRPKGGFLRPDRVMIRDKEAIIIDFKFGGKEDKKYIRQVKSYMTQIAKMGYSVLGFVSYVSLGKNIRIDP